MDASTLGRRLAFLAVACVAAAGGTTRLRGEAQQVPQLLTTAALPDGAAHAPERGVLRARAAQADLSILSDDVSVIDLALFGDARYRVVRESIERPGPGRLVWHGRIEGTTDVVSFAITDGVLVGKAFTPNGEYRLHPLAGGGGYAIEQFEQSVLLPEAPPVVPDPASFERPLEISRPTVDDGSVIDVLIVYTSLAREAAGGTAAMQALLDLAVSFTNMSYQNSGVVQRLRLVHRAEVTYVQHLSDMNVDLTRLRATNDGVLDTVHALRETYGADIVSLIGVQTNACGIGYLMESGLVSTAFASNAFNVTAWDCAAQGLSFAHELGHNMGLNHDTANGGGFVPAYPYAYGYRLPGLFRTVMSYDCTLQGLASCPRVMHFSTPTRTHTVTFHGTYVTGVAGASDNAQALNNTRTVTANFRSSIPSPGCDTGSYALSRTFTSNGPTDPYAEITVTAPLGCPWTARTNDTFFSMNPSSGHGNGTLRVMLTQNTTGSARIGAAVIAGQTFTVIQGALTLCTYFLGPTGTGVSYLPNQGTLTMTTQPGCPWTAFSNSPFITISNGTGRAGPGTAQFNVALNTTTAQRQGTISFQILPGIGGTVSTTVLQQAPPACTYSINPATVGIGNLTASGNINVTTQDWCNWSATSNSSFITVSNNTGRLGSGPLPFTVGTNGLRTTRQGTATIGGQTFTVNQGIAPLLRLAPDVNNDGTYDLVWQNRFGGGYLAAWMMNNLSLGDSALFNPGRIADPNWRVAATADMDGDGKMDLIFQEETQGWIGIWKMNGLNLVTSLAISIERVPDTNWKIVAAQDFNNDGKADLLWHDRALGYVALWYMNGVQVVASELLSPGRVADTNWQPEAAADFNSDGKPDILWRHQTQGWVVVWFMNGLTLTASRDLSPNRVADTNWRIAAVGDVNRDNMPDLIWHDIANGWIGVWLMNGHALASSIAFTPERVADTNWRIVGPK